MSSVLDILPARSKTFTRGIAVAMSDTFDVPYRQILNASTSPVAWLPFLGAHNSVDLWYSDWSEERRRQMIDDAPVLAELIGTVAAAQRFLDYVDTDIIAKVSHPARYPVGRIAAGITPINHKPFVANYLLKTEMVAPSKAVIVARTAVGRAAVRTIDREPLRRAKTAISISKAPETQYIVTFAYRIPITLDGDEVDLDTPGGFYIGKFKDRTRI